MCVASATLAVLAAQVAIAQTHGALQRRLVLKDVVDQPVVADGSVYYRSLSGERDVLKRLDLRTGRRTLLYRASRESFSINEVRAGGGQVAIGVWGEIGTRRLRSAVIVFSTADRRRRTVAAGREVVLHRGELPCGREVSL